MDPHDYAILLVDDEEPNRVLLGRRLSTEGYQVTAVEGGQAALDIMATKHFDMVLLDLMMPGMDGITTLNAIKDNPTYDDIPVLMLTASGARDAVVHCLSLGAVDYVIKPVDPPELKRRICRQLRREPSSKLSRKISE